MDTKVNYKTGLLQKAMVSTHRAFINVSYETKNKHWLFDATLQYNGKNVYLKQIQTLQSINEQTIA